MKANNDMKKLLIICAVLIQFVSCDNGDPEPDLEYLDNISAGQTTGQGIEYSDIPDDTLLFDYPSSSATRLIDINNDGLNDFELSFSGSASPGHQNSNNSIIPFGLNAVVVADLDSNIVDTLSWNDRIDNNLNWINNTCIIYNYATDATGFTSETGLWNDVTDRYIGAKIFADNNVLYGWIRIEVTSGWNLTLIDYACTVGY